MGLFGKPYGEKYHTRAIEVNTYEYDEGRLAVEGCLKDHRFQAYHLETGEKRPPGIMHQMAIHLLVNKVTLVIEDLKVDMPVVPDGHCSEVLKFMEPVKGLRIAGGFTSKIKELVGGSKGCTHIIELLAEMSFSTIQGLIAYKQQGPLMSKSELIHIVENTCWAWRSEGPMIKWMIDQIEAEKKIL